MERDVGNLDLPRADDDVGNGPGIVDRIDIDGLVPPRPPEPREPGRGPGGSAVPAAKFAPYFLLIAALVGTARISMLMFVARDPDPRVLVVAGASFVLEISAIAFFGGRYFFRNFGK